MEVVVVGDKYYYCNCESSCIHKDKKLHKTKTWEKGKWRTEEVQLCLNSNKSCTCKYQTDNISKAFKY